MFPNKIPFLTDTRDPHCRAATYDDVLPKASIIIIFTNEAWSPLIRTVWSVLDNTEADHLHEIILVDDFSDKTHLKGKSFSEALTLVISVRLWNFKDGGS